MFGTSQIHMLKKPEFLGSNHADKFKQHSMAHTYQYRPPYSGEVAELMEILRPFSRGDVMTFEVCTRITWGHPQLLRP